MASPQKSPHSGHVRHFQAGLQVFEKFGSSGVYLTISDSRSNVALPDLYPKGAVSNA